MVAPAAPRLSRCEPLAVTIPGVPVAQGRGRAVRFGDSVRVIDPAKSRSWKGAAQVFMLQARGRAGMHAAFDGPLWVTIRAYWPRPKSLPKKAGVESYYRTSRPDADNLCKCVFDAGNGVLWGDDSQIVIVTVSKWVCALGADPRVEVNVESALAAREGIK